MANNKNVYDPKQVIEAYRKNVSESSNNAAKMMAWYMDTQTDEITELKDAVGLYLKVYAELDEGFSKKLKNDKKSLDRCVSFIFDEVRKQHSGGRVCAVSKVGVFNMASHYYDEDDLAIDKVDDKTVENIQKRTKAITEKALSANDEKKAESAKMLELF